MSDRPRALDLFCGAGGASEGLRRAGFRVVAVDIARQPQHPSHAFDDYEFEILEGDALEFLEQHGGGFDLIWASPPCQAYTAYRRSSYVGDSPELIGEVRALLEQCGRPYIIENVPGAPLQNPITLCGSSFGLDVRRHREFECSFHIEAPPCIHGWQKPRFPAATNREIRQTVEVGVYRIPTWVQRLAMGIDWMSKEPLSEAIPPAYSEFLGRAWRMRAYQAPETVKEPERDPDQLELF